MTTQNNNNRQAFTFYRSFYDALKTLPASSRLELYDAILSLSFDELEPNLSLATSKRFWALIRPNLLTSFKNWKNGCQPKRSDAPSQNEATPSLKIKTKNKIIDKEKKEYIYTSSFQELWDIYLHRGRKPKAFKCYQVAIKQVDHEVIKKALHMYIKDNPEIKYRKYLEGWLDGQMWESYVYPIIKQKEAIVL